MKTSIVIPVYNEKGRLEKVVSQLNAFYEVLIIDDASIIPVSSYLKPSEYQNIKIIRNSTNLGYLASVRLGILHSNGDIVITMDGDGEHQVSDIVKLIEPIKANRCDIVFGKRPNIARFSEVFLLKIAKIFTGEKVADSGTGFRAIRTTFAKRLEFGGVCTCGMLLLELHDKDMRICEIEVNLPIIDKPRRVAWEHFIQLFIILRYMLKFRK